jgi:hypothetical protein
MDEELFEDFMYDLSDIDAITNGQYDDLIHSLNIHQIHQIIFACLRGLNADGLEQIFTIYRHNNTLPKIHLESKECIYEGFSYISRPLFMNVNDINEYLQLNVETIKRLMDIIVNNVEYSKAETIFLNNSELFSYWLELNPSILQNPKTVFVSIFDFFDDYVREYCTPEVIQENLNYILTHQQVPYNYLIDYAIDYRNESAIERVSDNYLNSINEAINFIQENKGIIEESLYSFDVGLYEYLDEPQLRNMVQNYHTSRDSGFCVMM